MAEPVAGSCRRIVLAAHRSSSCSQPCVTAPDTAPADSDWLQLTRHRKREKHRKQNLGAGRINPSRTHCSGRSGWPRKCCSARVSTPSLASLNPAGMAQHVRMNWEGKFGQFPSPADHFEEPGPSHRPTAFGVEDDAALRVHQPQRRSARISLPVSGCCCRCHAWPVAHVCGRYQARSCSRSIRRARWHVAHGGRRSGLRSRRGGRTGNACGRHPGDGLDFLRGQILPLTQIGVPRSACCGASGSTTAMACRCRLNEPARRPMAIRAISSPIIAG
jgi:hypothetical protein